jgi:cystathionine beta-synthase
MVAAAAKRRPAIFDLIGDTPLVPITQIDTGGRELFIKLENRNPTGSIN